MNIRDYIVEYVTSDVYSLFKYLSISDADKKKYLYEMYPYQFPTFLKHSNIEVDVSEIDDWFDYDGVIALLNKNPKLKKRFNEYLFEGINTVSLKIPDEDYPAWSFFSDHPEIIKNQWLVHFTSYSSDIYRHGFKYGVDEIDKLGLTTRLSDIDKKYGGFNFAYTLHDFPRYARNRHGYKYGEEVVLFRASGVRVFHHSDGEYQTIFYGSTAKNIYPLTEHNGMWSVTSNLNGHTLYEDDNLEKVIDWFVHNYNQYRKHLSNPYGKNVWLLLENEGYRG